MTPEQRGAYWAYYWPQAMKAQKWDREPKQVQERLRKALTREVSEGRTDSITLLREHEITTLWALLKNYARPLNLRRARAAANPEEAQIDNKCRQYVFKINELGFTDAYIQRIAGWDCRECRVADWKRLPIELKPGEHNTAGLRRLLIHLTQRRNEKPHKSEPDQVIPYQMKPFKKFTPTPVASEISDNTPY